MAKFNEGQIVKTYRDNEFKVKIVDGQSGITATKILTIEPDGTAISAGTNDFGTPVLFKTDETSPNLIIPRTDPDGNVKVVIVPSSDTDKKWSYHLHDSVAKDGTDDHAVTVTDTKTAKNFKVILSGLGLNHWEIGSYNGVDTLTPWCQAVSSPANPVVELNLPMPEIVGDGTLQVMVRLTNRDNANDAYSTIQWYEENTTP